MTHAYLSRARALVVVAVGLCLVLASGQVAGARVRRLEHYTLRAFKFRHSQVRAISFVGGKGYVMRMVHARPSYTGAGYPAVFLPSHGAIAGVNGSFKMHDFAPASRFLTVTHGELWTTGTNQRGWVFTSNSAGTRAWIERPHWSIEVTGHGISFAVSSWNYAQPRDGSVVAFTGRGGVIRPRAKTCSAYLDSLSGDLADHVYEVTARRANTDCTRDPLKPSASSVFDVVLAGKPVAALQVGQRVHISVHLHHAGITEAFGGWPQLVNDGSASGSNCLFCGGPPSGSDDPIFYRNPRTAIGISKGCEDTSADTVCRMFMVTVDGRQPDWSRGLRFPALADLMIDLGAYDALNLDGGGSTLMWTRQRSTFCQRHQGPVKVGCIVNRPCYTERLVVDAIGVSPAA